MGFSTLLPAGQQGSQEPLSFPRSSVKVALVDTYRVSPVFPPEALWSQVAQRGTRLERKSRKSWNPKDMSSVAVLQ